jgi:hypothetical protein
VRNVTAGQVRLESSRVLTVTGYTDYGVYVGNSQLVISDTLFSGNGDNASDYALYATGASTVLTITGSTFQNTAGYGLYASNGTSIWTSDSAFTGNGNYTFTNSTFVLGSVGIGTTAPTQKLDVNGSANITGNITAGGIKLGDNVKIYAGDSDDTRNYFNGTCWRTEVGTTIFAVCS